MSAIEISVVIPVFNERENIGDLIGEIVDGMPEQPCYEIVVVDDGSTDGGREVLHDLASVVSQLRVLSHRARCGQSAALQTGIRAARGSWIVTLDGDGQNVPGDIPLLWSSLPDKDTSVCHCAVIGRRQGRRDSLSKRLASRIANRVRNSLLSDGAVDTGCGLKLFPRQLFLELPNFDHMHRFLPALVLRAGGRLVPVDVRHRPRAGGKSKYGIFDRLWAGLIDVLGVMWLQRRQRKPIVDKES